MREGISLQRRTKRAPQEARAPACELSTPRVGSLFGRKSRASCHQPHCHHSCFCSSLCAVAALLAARLAALALPLLAALALAALRAANLHSMSSQHLLLALGLVFEGFGLSGPVLTFDQGLSVHGCSRGTGPEWP